MSHKIVSISLSTELVDQIEGIRNDLPRSLIFKRLLEAGLKTNGNQQVVSFGSNQNGEVKVT